MDKIAHLIDSIYFADDFVAKTSNERALKTLLVENRYHYRPWDEIAAAEEKQKIPKESAETVLIYAVPPANETILKELPVGVEEVMRECVILKEFLNTSAISGSEIMAEFPKFVTNGKMALFFLKDFPNGKRSFINETEGWPVAVTKVTRITFKKKIKL